MDAECLVSVFEAGLLPFLRDHYPDGHCLQQDNDPKHASHRIEQHGVNWWATPPESPDLNPSLGLAEAIFKKYIQAKKLGRT